MEEKKNKQTQKSNAKRDIIYEKLIENNWVSTIKGKINK